MSFLLTVYVAVRALLRNKMRAALTVLVQRARMSDAKPV